MGYGGSSYGDASYGSTAATTQTVFTPETSLVQETLTPQLQPGNADLQVTPPTTLIQATVNPELQVGPATLTVQETSLLQETPAFAVGVGQRIVTPATTLTQSTPTPQVNAVYTMAIPETSLSATNPQVGLNRRIVFGVVTQLSTENPEPSIEPGTVNMQVQETSLLQSTETIQVQPGNTDVQVTPPTTLNTETPEFTVQAGATSLNVDATELVIQDTPLSVAIDIKLAGKTRALITTPNKFVDMDQHTFKEGDLGDSLEATLKDDDGVIDLRGVDEVKVLMEDTDGNQKLTQPVTVTDAANGEVTYEWQSGDPIETAQVLRAEFEIIDGTGKPETVPNNGYLSIKIEEDLN